MLDLLFEIEIQKILVWYSNIYSKLYQGQYLLKYILATLKTW